MTPHTTVDTVYEGRWWTLAVLCLSMLIVFVGNSSLNVALPSLARDLGATESQLRWVVASCSVVFAGLPFSAGALGDRSGRGEGRRERSDRLTPSASNLPARLAPTGSHEDTRPRSKGGHNP